MMKTKRRAKVRNIIRHLRSEYFLTCAGVGEYRTLKAIADDLSNKASALEMQPRMFLSEKEVREILIDIAVCCIRAAVDLT
jgi:hypothetical protein